jgi:hypothetical protein
VQFGEVVLVGWRPFPDYWPAATDGTIPLFESYIVELFWQIPESTNIPYFFYIAYIDNEVRYAGVDRPLGSVSFPHRTTEQWQPDVIYGEIVGFNVESDVPQERSGQVRIGVWYVDEHDDIINVSTATDEGYYIMDSLAVFNILRPPAPPDLPESELVFGELIALRGYSVPETAHPDKTITLSFYWEALRDVPDNYTLFLHLVDENGEIAAQRDSEPVPHLLTDNWVADYPLLAEIPLTLPQTTGVYHLYAGLYNESGRLSVDALDNRVLLAEVTIE